MYICVKLSHFAVQQRLAHYKATILQLKKKKKKEGWSGSLGLVDANYYTQNG